MKTIILLHGALGCSEEFSNLIHYLGNDYNFLTFDFSGHGQSEYRSGDLSIELFASDLNNFIDSKQLANVNIFGYSMGGYVALYYASNNFNNISKIFTFATKFDWTPENALNESKQLDSSRILEKVPNYAAELQKMHGNKWDKLLSQTSDFMINLGNNPALNDNLISKIEIPTLISVGDKDKMVSINESYNLYKKLPSSNFCVMPNTNHPIKNLNLNRLKTEFDNFF